MGLQVSGLEQLARELRAMPERAGRTAQRRALVAGGELIAKKAGQNAPRRPGQPDMADHIVISNARPEDGSVGIAVGPASRFFYGSYQEFGTAHHPAQPFLRPAFDSELAQALRAIADSLWASIRRAGGGSSRASGGGGGLL